MRDKTRATFLSLTIIAVIIFSAVGPTIVYADGGSDSPPAETITPPEETGTETTGEVTEAPAEVAPVEPVLTGVPENTSVTVLDANGEAQPLATQEAAEAIATSDPIWCPEGTSPAPGANGCTGSFTSFDELLTFLSGNPTYQGAGTIYVEQGNYQGNEPGGVIDFNAPTYDLTNIRNSNLTVTGGWNTGTGSVDPANTSDFTNTRILIGSDAAPWGGSVTINNITMTFTNPAAEIPLTPENALTVNATGDVVLSNVDISNAPSAGAEIDADGGVIIENSKFHRNKTAGAIVRAGGNVTIVDSEFQNPLVTRQRRQIVGLDVTSGGAVTLANVIANGNREEGVDINAAGAVTVGNSVFSGTKEIRGPRNAPTEFLGFGLRVVTPAEINVDNVTANDNFLWGAFLDGGGAIAVANSIFNANTTEAPGFIDDTGLFIRGDSIVSLFNVEANDNRLYGTQIEAVGNVSINESTFNNNRGITTTAGGDTFHGHGMQIMSQADILINNTDASGNSLFGGQLNAGGQVAINNSTFNDTSTGSDSSAMGKGLEIVSGGNTNLAGVVLNNSQTIGAAIQAGGIVWLENVTATDSGADGVSLDTGCTFLIGGTYSGNGGFGLDLGRSALNLLTPPTFSNNGAGDMNPANPATCSFPTPPAAAAAPSLSSTAAVNIFAAAPLVPAALVEDTETAASAVNNSVAMNGSENVSLSTFLGGTKTGTGSVYGGIFAGKYAYVHTETGIQIFALAPMLDSLAME